MRQPLSVEAMFMSTFSNGSEESHKLERYAFLRHRIKKAC